MGVLSVNFFVLGLPRSRTAWLANFLTYGDKFCFHEGINGCRSIDEFKSKLGPNGDSGTSMMLFDMNALFPDAPIVIIERDPIHVIEYVKETFDLCESEVLYRAKEKLDKIDGLRIQYEDINNKLPEIWEHLIGEGFNKKRADMLIKLNIQVSDPYDFDLEATKELFNEVSFS